MFGVPNMTRHRSPRRLPLTAAAVALALLSGCAIAAPGSPADDRPVVLTTFTVLQDMAARVAGDRLRVESVTKPGAEVHGYEPTPSDIRRGAGAAVVLENGLGLETWAARFVDSIDAPRVTVSDGVETIGIGGDADRPNPHAWMSPAHGAIYVENIVAALSRIAPEHADEFARNGRAFRVELEAVHGRLLDALRRVPAPERALVTCEGAFSYLARDADLTERYIWPVNAEQQATPQQIAGVIEFVRDRRVPAVFCESTVSDRPVREVVSATGTTFGGTLYVDSLSGPDGPVPTYLDLLEHDVDVIVRGLTAGRG